MRVATSSPAVTPSAKALPDAPTVSAAASAAGMTAVLGCMTTLYESCMLRMENASALTKAAPKGLTLAPSTRMVACPCPSSFLVTRSPFSTKGVRNPAMPAPSPCSSRPLTRSWTGSGTSAQESL